MKKTKFIFGLLLPALIMGFASCGGGGGSSSSSTVSSEVTSSETPSSSEDVTSGVTSISVSSGDDVSVPDPVPPRSQFYVLVNGGPGYYGLINDGAWNIDSSYTQYYISDLTLHANDTFVIYDANNSAGWAPATRDEASATEVIKDGDKYKCNADGVYDICLKMKSGEDIIYIGKH